MTFSRSIAIVSTMQPGNSGSSGIAAFIRKWARKRKGKLIASFHGHIHESPDRSGAIRCDMEGIPAFNPEQGSGEGARFRYVVFETA